MLLIPRVRQGLVAAMVEVQVRRAKTSQRMDVCVAALAHDFGIESVGETQPPERKTLTTRSLNSAPLCACAFEWLVFMMCVCVCQCGVCVCQQRFLISLFLYDVFAYACGTQCCVNNCNMHVLSSVGG